MDINACDLDRVVFSGVPVFVFRRGTPSEKFWIFFKFFVRFFDLRSYTYKEVRGCRLMAKRKRMVFWKS